LFDYICIICYVVSGLNPRKEEEMDTWNSKVLAYKEVSGRKSFLLQASWKMQRIGPQAFARSKPLWQIPGGGNKDHPKDKDPRATARREFTEETGLGIPETVNLVEIAHECISGNSYMEDFHDRWTFLVPLLECKGVLRTSEIHDGNRIIGPPRLVAEEKAECIICHSDFVALMYVIKQKKSPNERKLCLAG
jgi:8-oxo-dGTP pyrophosphatase MutT (NUDIX family)